MQALDADKCMVKVVSLAGLSCEGLASETMVKAQDASSIVGWAKDSSGVERVYMSTQGG